MRLRQLFILLALAASAGVGRAQDLIYGLSGGASPRLISFNSATPATQVPLPVITGVVSGQTLQSIDFRPSNGQLYGLSTDSAGTSAQLYTIGLIDGVATTVGGTITLAGNQGPQLSIDFNPVADALRVITANRQNYRVNANTGGLIQRDDDITRPSDPVGITPTGLAYTNNVPGSTSTTLYAYEANASSINTVGAVGGGTGANSPNAGVLNPVGSTSPVTPAIPPGGVDVRDIRVGFDISGSSNTAYLSFDDANSAASNNEFYTVNLANGVVTLIGGNDSLPTLLDFSVFAPVPVPEPASLLLVGAAGVAVVARRRRAKDAAPSAVVAS